MLKNYGTNVFFNVFLHTVQKMLPYTIYNLYIFDQIIFVLQIWKKNFNELFMICIYNVI